MHARHDVSAIYITGEATKEKQGTDPTMIHNAILFAIIVIGKQYVFEK